MNKDRRLINKVLKFSFFHSPKMDDFKQLGRLLNRSPSLFSTSELERTLRLKISFEYEDWTLGGFGSPDRYNGKQTYDGYELKRGAREELVRRFVAKITDPTVLAKTAVEAEDWNVRVEAVKKLADQAVLAKAALEDKHPVVRANAARHLNDQAALAKVVCESQDRDIRAEVAKKITDQAVLAKVCMEEKESSVRANAIKNLTDQAALAKIAFEDNDASVRKAALGKLTDQQLLSKVAMEDKTPAIREAAIKNLTDQSVLTKVAFEDKDASVRKAAVWKLTDQAVLSKLTMLVTKVDERELSVRWAAVRRLTDQALLAKFFAEFEKVSVTSSSQAEDMWRTLEISILGLRDQALLEQVATKSDSYRYIRFLAIKNLTDQAALSKLAVEEKDPHFRKLAESRLMELGNKQLTQEACYGWTRYANFR